MLAALAAFGARSANAHHSFSALFDATRTVTVTGRIVVFEFEAPHSYIHLQVPGEPGAEPTEWQVETATPGMLVRRGITPDRLPPGGTISAVGNPTRDGRPLMRLLTITMPDGTEIRVQ